MLKKIPVIILFSENKPGIVKKKLFSFQPFF